MRRDVAYLRHQALIFWQFLFTVQIKKSFDRTVGKAGHMKEYHYREKRYLLVVRQHAHVTVRPTDITPRPHQVI